MVMALYHSNRKRVSRGTQGLAVVVDLSTLFGKTVEGFATLIWKSIKCSELNRLFCGIMEDKNVGEIFR